MNQMLTQVPAKNVSAALLSIVAMSVIWSCKLTRQRARELRSEKASMQPAETQQQQKEMVTYYPP